jgi:methylmalonyl-CoA decarboxylase
MPLIETHIDGVIGTIVLNHSDTRNALSRELVDAVVASLARFSEQKVRVVVLRAQPGAKV